MSALPETFHCSFHLSPAQSAGWGAQRVTVSFRVTDHTAATHPPAADRAAALRSLAELALQEAYRQLRSAYPHLLAADLEIPRVELSLDLALPTWFAGAPPQPVTAALAAPLVRSVAAAAVPALDERIAAESAGVAQAAEQGAFPDPTAAPGLISGYRKAQAALAQGVLDAAARMYRTVRQARSWAEAEPRFVPAQVTSRPATPAAAPAGQPAPTGAPGPADPRPAPVRPAAAEAAESPPAARVDRPPPEAAAPEAAAPTSPDPLLEAVCRSLEAAWQLHLSPLELAAVLGAAAGPLAPAALPVGLPPGAPEPPALRLPLTRAGRAAAAAAIRRYLGGEGGRAG